MNKESANDGCHSRRKNNNGNTILSRPFVKIAEVRVELDVFAEELDALGEWGFDAVHHFLKGIPGSFLSENGECKTSCGSLAVPKGYLVFQGILVPLLAQLLAIAKIVCLGWA